MKNNPILEAIRFGQKEYNYVNKIANRVKIGIEYEYDVNVSSASKFLDVDTYLSAIGITKEEADSIISRLEDESLGIDESPYVEEYSDYEFYDSSEYEESIQEAIENEYQSVIEDDLDMVRNQIRDEFDSELAVEDFNSIFDFYLRSVDKVFSRVDLEIPDDDVYNYDTIIKIDEVLRRVAALMSMSAIEVSDDIYRAKAVLDTTDVPEICGDVVYASESIIDSTDDIAAYLESVSDRVLRGGDKSWNDETEESATEAFNEYLKNNRNFAEVIKDIYNKYQQLIDEYGDISNRVNSEFKQYVKDAIEEELENREDGIRELAYESASDRVREYFDPSDDVIDKIVDRYYGECVAVRFSLSFYKKYHLCIPHESSSDDNPVQIIKEILKFRNNVWGINTNTQIREVTKDLSVPNGVEVITKALPMKEAIDLYYKMSKHINDVGSTGMHTGMHVNISIDGVDMTKLNPVKMFLLIDPRSLEKDFALRRHVESSMSFIESNAKKIIISLLNYQTIRQVRTVIQQHIRSDEKYQQINLKHIGTGVYHERRVEFRFFGGPGYQDRPEDVIKNMYKAVHALAAGLDPLYMEKEYISRVIRLLDKFLEKRLIRMDVLNPLLRATYQRGDMKTNEKLQKMMDEPITFVDLRDVWKKRK